VRRETSAIWRVLSTLGGWTLALLILFEEWGWTPLARAFGVLARLPAIAWLERRVAALPPWVALAAFVVPMLLLLPFKIGALWLVARGRAVLGVSLFVLAKLVGTGVGARLFLLVQPQLMRLGWFARLYVRWIAWKDAWTARVRAAWRRALE
jgi:hypothetical protein